MEIKIEKIIYPGKSLGSVNGRMIMTNEGLPEEIVEITPLEGKKSYTEAKTTKILKPSEFRIAARCSHYQVCSPYQYIEYKKQVAIKESQLKEIFPNIPITTIPSPEIYGYRNKVKLNVLWKNGKASLVYHIPRSRDKFIQINSCHLVSENANNLLKSVIEIINKENLNTIREIELRESYSNKKLMVITYPAEQCENSLDKLFSKFGVNNTYIEETLLGKTFRIGPKSFFQINVPMLEIALKKMQESMCLDRKEIIADLYCGIGTFGIILSQCAKKVIGIESDPDNISFLKGNLKLNKIENFKLYEGACEKIFPSKLNSGIDILVLDPPRKGLESMLCRNIMISSIKKILYLSCNPITLSRDLKILGHSYTTKNIFHLDFFPHTPHIETLAILEKK